MTTDELMLALHKQLGENVQAYVYKCLEDTQAALDKHGLKTLGIDKQKPTEEIIASASISIMTDALAIMIGFTVPVEKRPAILHETLTYLTTSVLTMPESQSEVMAVYSGRMH